jgi:hypothetical protein
MSKNGNLPPFAVTNRRRKFGRHFGQTGHFHEIGDELPTSEPGQLRNAGCSFSINPAIIDDACMYRMLAVCNPALQDFTKDIVSSTPPIVHALYNGSFARPLQRLVCTPFTTARLRQPSATRPFFRTNLHFKQFVKTVNHEFRLKFWSKCTPNGGRFVPKRGELPTAGLHALYHGSLARPLTPHSRSVYACIVCSYARCL